MIRRRYYPLGESGEVRECLDALRKNPQKKKAAAKLDIDIQTLEMFWPRTMNVTVRILRGWEPLRELKRPFDKIAYRIFFCIREGELWLLSACEKSSGKTPRSELERAYRRMRDVLEGRV
ncbi:MAG: type II toxin-antitoxin system RelE/ParE family toxin [Elusimicrobia bacterium]|nr:type II toxin-antitoxin system RelE/ParE family toxin [Elusimicrobiota bacterium]